MSGLGILQAQAKRIYRLRFLFLAIGLLPIAAVGLATLLNSDAVFVGPRWAAPLVHFAFALVVWSIGLYFLATWFHPEFGRTSAPRRWLPSALQSLDRLMSAFLLVVWFLSPLAGFFLLW